MEDGVFGGLILGLVAVFIFYYKFLRKEEKRQPDPKRFEGISPAELLEKLEERRILWSELDQVLRSGVLDEISPSDKVLQESIFELVTSEASFNRSVNVLIDYIFASNHFQEEVGAQELKLLRSNIDEIQRVSNSFLQDLLQKWEDSVYVTDVGELINYYAINGFKVYKEYCGNQPNQENTFHKLLHKESFTQMLKQLEENPKCLRLTLDSYLMKPMQRITRLPLLLGAILKRLDADDKHRPMCEEAFQNLTLLVQQCNEAARETQDSLEVHQIVSKFDNVDATEDALGKFVVKEEFVKYWADSNGNGFRTAKLNFRKQKPKPCLLILYTNILFVFRRRSSGKLELLDAVPTKNANVTIKLFPHLRDEVSKEYPVAFVVHFTQEKSFHILGAKLRAQVETWQQKLETYCGGMTRNFDTITRTSSSP